jgi:hypothetical protein
LEYLCIYSPCAIQTKKNNVIIKNPCHALRYICKYFSKSRYQKSETRLIFISNNLVKKPVGLLGSAEDILKGYKGIYILQTSDYSTLYRITNNNEFDRFCKEFLYDLFDCGSNNTDFLHQGYG